MCKKFKMLCGRCLADSNAFTVYANSYNTGKCFSCNGHGYILTKDELKAKESHVKYLDTIIRKTKGVEIASNQEIAAMKELKEHEEKHQEANKEAYERFVEALEAFGENQSPEIMQEFLKVNTEWEATKTAEYKSTWNMLDKEYKKAKKDKEKAIDTIQKAQQFYIDLMIPVEK